MPKTNSFLIAAATSNTGKTTLSVGLMRALSNHGLKVQPFKCGPDYIDTMFHHIATGRESINLDTFMSSPEHVRHLFDHFSQDADISIVEGVMGLFDGYESWNGSSAEIAMLLDIPVILVVSAKSTAYSVAPLIHGFKSFLPPTTKAIPNPKHLNIAGVIFNQVASENHYNLLKSACEDTATKCLGYIPRNPQLTVPGRHLGLTISEQSQMETFIALAAQETQNHILLNELL